MYTNNAIVLPDPLEVSEKKWQWQERSKEVKEFHCLYSRVGSKRYDMKQGEI
jgi:hypothetical protein